MPLNFNRVEFIRSAASPRDPGRRKEIAAVRSSARTAAQTPSTSLTVHSASRTALVTAAQTMSAPASA